MIHRDKLAGMLILAILIAAWAPITSAEPVENEENITIHFFYDEGCSHCAAQEQFMEENIVGEYPKVKIKKYDIYGEGSVDKLNELAEEHGTGDLRVVTPTTFIEGRVFQGFTESRGREMIQVIEGEETEQSEKIEVPFFGEMNPTGWSLPILAAAIGSVDGMNVCSIGALVMVLMIVLSFDDRKKIFFYGFLFIITVVLVYGLLVFAWYHLIEAIIQYIGILKYIIGAAGIIGGAAFFKQFVEFYKHGPNCSYSDAGFITRARMKVKKSFESANVGPFVLVGSIVFFAAVVTIIELPCSAALPLAFSGILVDAELAGLTYIIYIALYLFFYMLIELIIFSGAVITKEVWFGSGKFVTWVTLFGSLILFVLGFSYLFGIGIA